MAGCEKQARRTDVDTIKPMVVPPPPGWDTAPQPSPWRWLRWAGPIMLGLAILLGAAQVSLPYYAFAPGDARQVNDLISVPKDRRFPAKGEVLLSTVSLRRVNALEAFIGWLDDDTDVVHEDAVLGTTPRSQFTEQNVEDMRNSKQTAAVVALRRLGYTVAETGKGALIQDVGADTPAAGHLAQGDVVVGIDGSPVALAGDAIAGLKARQPGDTVRLDVQDAKGVARVEEIVLGARPDGAGGYLGVVLRTKEQKFDFPFDVVIDSGRIGGPSAGLAFTLGVIDSLTVGELTGGRKVAATGTIELNGEVGDVGAVTQKTAAVRAAGADVFLVPPGEYEEAKDHAGPKLKIVKVATLDDALTEMARLGGDVSALGGISAGNKS